jgi:diguanylate cyclase (GGDEF)-like protein
VDLDHFKAVNDTYGHDTGDQVLREIAATFRKTLRASDVICRIGGEEFLVICRDTSAPNAGICAERLRRQVENTRIKVAGEDLRVTISIGVATRNPLMPNAADLIKLADIAAYASKKAGRNRVSLTDPDAH